MDLNLKFLYKLSKEESIIFRELNDVTFDNVYVTDTWNSCIKKVTPEGKFLAKCGSMGLILDNFVCQKYTVADNNLMYITEHHNHCQCIYRSIIYIQIDKII